MKNNQKNRPNDVEQSKRMYRRRENERLMMQVNSQLFWSTHFFQVI